MAKSFYPRPWMTNAREKKGYSTSDLAAKVGTTRSHIWAIEVGRRTPRRELAHKIARELCVDVGNFMRLDVQNEHDISRAQ
ncbi:helix-turn-helix transcriptional regulator [Alicyclobacillus dauci]|uniref:Helix-turn-helix domain-containing protein n=1 Tax=Alicyclobacillus dauci TaxID=1475485 RepID=A0ABY6YY20_9BACL|nr:helix-turn-helix transcriptional regulator [Alicyclobacillus dauci]WAH35001.1 helix-turn-helix domain-containing protein [Alicyclobacillus dauci]